MINIIMTIKSFNNFFSFKIYFMQIQYLIIEIMKDKMFSLDELFMFHTGSGSDSTTDLKDLSLWAWKKEAFSMKNFDFFVFIKKYRFFSVKYLKRILAKFRTENLSTRKNSTLKLLFENQAQDLGSEPMSLYIRWNSR